MTQNEKNIQEIIFWIKKKSPEPWEVLYEMATQHPDLIKIKVGKLLLVKWGLREVVQRFVARYKGVEHEVPTLNKGGELLTRVDDRIVGAVCSQLDISEGSFIGKSFSAMPTEKMDEVSPILIQQQLLFIKNCLPRESNYSLNIEAPQVESIGWKQIIKVLRTNSSPNVRLELIERVKFPDFALQQLADVCRVTGMGIYIDDLGSNRHSLPNERKYIIKILKFLGKYIVAVKIDYDIVKDMAKEGEKGDDTAARVVRNIFYFSKLWRRYVGHKRSCCIIFESMPNKDRDWLVLIQKVCQLLFNKIYWQID